MRGVAVVGTNGVSNVLAGGARRIMKKVLSFGVVAFLIFYVVTRPSEAAGVTKQIGSWLKSIAVGLGNFVSNVV
jgi:hypothetical protein